MVPPVLTPTNRLPPVDPDKLATRILGGPLAAAVALLIVGFLATWIPHYLTWPWWPDHDTNAAMALGWEAGVLPYRDVRAFAFPGQRARKGTRWPPSYRSALWPRKTWLGLCPLARRAP